MSYDPTPVPPAQPPKSNTTVVVLVIIIVGGGLMFIACAGILVALLLPAVQAAREAARRNACSNNVRQIVIALENYNARNGSYPPAYVTDKDGRPMHSWRVLILPYLEQTALHKAYDFNEPWNGPNNSKLADKMPDVFRCPSIPEEGDFTNYVAVVGDQTAWPGATGRQHGEITDGLSNTVLVVEAAGSGIHWMEPRDLTVDQAANGVNAPAGGGIKSNHPGGAMVGFCDGHVLYLDEGLPPDAIRGLLTVDGNEEVNLH